MGIKTKSLLMLGIPFMLLFFTGCPTPTVKDVIKEFPKSHKIKKTVTKNIAFTGESVVVTIRVENRSPYVIEKFWIQKETKKANYQTTGENKIECGSLWSNSATEVSYTLIPLSPGILHIPPARITKVKVRYLKETVNVPDHLGYSNSLKIKVIPVKISLQHLPGKINVETGKRIDAQVVVKNSSPYDVKDFQLRLDYNTKNFVFLKNPPESGMEINNGKELVIPYSIMTVSGGTSSIIAKIRKIKFDEKDKIFFPLWRDCLSAELKISVKPLKLQASYNFDKTKIKLMEHSCAEFHIQNLSNTRIDGIEYGFLESGNQLKQLHASSNPNTLCLPPGETRIIKYRYRAIQAGTVNPKVVIKEIKVNDCWLAFDNRFLKTGKITPLEISALRLPGYEKPIEHICPGLEKYYDHFALKVIGIALIILVLITLFRLLISSVIVEFMFGKMFLNLSIAATLSQTLLIFLTGCVWFWRTLPPSPLDLAAIAAGSICMCFIFGLFPVKNLVLGSLLSGVALFIASYMVFTGLKTYDLQNFSNYPASLSIALFFLLGWVINLWIFRKIKSNRRK